MAFLVVAGFSVRGVVLNSFAAIERIGTIRTLVGTILKEQLAELIAEESPMITAVVALIEPRTRLVRYALAGHPPPLLLVPGHAARLLESGSPPLGLAASVSFQTRSFRAVEGSVVVLYTDGAIEHSRDLDEGEALLRAAAEAACKESSREPAPAIQRSIFATRARRDDVAILVVRFGLEPPRCCTPQPLAAGAPVCLKPAPRAACAQRAQRVEPRCAVVATPC